VDFSSVHINHDTLLDQLTARIERQICDGELALGQRLPSESVIATTYGVSRPLVREALSRLRARGYIRTVVGRGTFVRHPDASDLAEAIVRHTSLSSDRPITADDLYDARGAVEVLASRMAAEHRTDEECEQLAVHMSAMERAVHEPAAFAAADAGFHVAIAHASHNPLLPTLLSPLMSMMVDGMLRSHTNPAAVEAGVADHRLILDRVRTQDPEGAAEAMANHLRGSRIHYSDR
jgi:GntR family transcriptional repressor for pyruvate dehydrogenase complex